MICYQSLVRIYYYPKGILSQSAEAGKKATRFNATIGIATEGNVPMHFKHIQEHLIMILRIFIHMLHLQENNLYVKHGEKNN